MDNEELKDVPEGGEVTPEVEIPGEEEEEDEEPTEEEGTDGE
jgi:hypothetical protein